MAAESSSSRSAAGGGGAPASPESYIGSLISLTSKSEIRYEGVLYNINTEESSIGLRNVRSFGTEGRKKDGQQIPGSDKVYEYILFRGSDIKDLQVKSSPPTDAAPLHNDPAIIQSHYSRPASTSSSLPSIGSGAGPDLSSHAAQYGLQRPSFQSSLPLYQPGGGSWASSAPPPAATGSALSVPQMYWQGYYAPSSGLPPHLQPPHSSGLPPHLQQPPSSGLPPHLQQPPSSGLPHLQQPPLLRPTPGLSVPQPMQYPGLNASLPSGPQKLTELQSPLLQPSGASQGLAFGILSTTSAPTSASLLASETSEKLLPNMSPLFSPPVPSLGVSIPLATPLTSNVETSVTLPQNLPPLVSSKPVAVPGSMLAFQTVSQTISSNVASSRSVQVETSMPSLASGQLVQAAPSVLPSSQSLQVPSQTSHNDEVKPVEAKSKVTKPLLPDPPSCALPETNEPILPLPKPLPRKPNGAPSYNRHGAPPYNHHGAPSYNHHNFRGRGRGRGSAFSHSVTKFTEEFDFMAMNEKFNKDEVWGHLGKKAQSRDKDGELRDDELDDNLEDEETEDSQLDVKPVYVKDDFFDSLSCGALDRGGQNGRPKFSEQLKIDTETFGDFPRHRQPFRGGGRGFRGVGRGRGSYYGRGYGNMGRGRGNSYPHRGGGYGRG